MKLKIIHETKTKIILFAVVPLLVVSFVIAMTVHRHSVLLAEQLRQVIKTAYLASKDEELKNYVALAKNSIEGIDKAGAGDEGTREQAKATLAKLEYGGRDGYFFLFDINGKLLMHPRLTERVQQVWWNYKDANGKLVIQDLVRRGRAGGGFEDYLWEKPSLGNALTPKRAYVVELPNLGWILGTGVYLDDVEDALTRINMQVSRSVFDTTVWIAATALISVTVMILFGWSFNTWERRDATWKERERIAGELHAGVCQRLGAAKLTSERKALELTEVDGPTDLAEEALRHTAAEIGVAMLEVREISHGLHPETLMQFGLAHTLQQLQEKWAGSFSGEIELTIPGEARPLGLDSSFVLYRVAQEALQNSIKHAEATKIAIRLRVGWRRVELVVADNGRGLPEGKNFTSGIGLINMKERVKEIGGILSITSTKEGVIIRAVVPQV
ncbi:MAG: histidine kinase [Nitrosospira multiformis]|jgi:two-component system NarL family sensor kinase|nr:histidine kinase [Nitrosospira multiformis]